MAARHVPKQKHLETRRLLKCEQESTLVEWCNLQSESAMLYHPRDLRVHALQILIPQ